MKNKPLKKQMKEQFYHKNRMIFCIAVLGEFAAGSLNLGVSWIMQQLIDTASGVPEAIPFSRLLQISAGFLIFLVAVFLVAYVSKPRFMERAMRQYKEFAFRKLTEKSISSFQDEGTAAYLSTLSNDASTIEVNYLEQQFSLVMKAFVFTGAFLMMLWYSPLMTAIAVGLTILPFLASILTGGRLKGAERRVSDGNTDFTTALKDCLGGFAVVKSFKAEKEILELFAQRNRALEAEKFTRRRIKTMVGMIGTVTGIFAQLGVFLAGAYLAMSGRGLTPGTVIMFVNLMNFVIEPVAEFPGLLAGRKAAMGLIGKLAEALEKNVTPAASGASPSLPPDICLDRVSFGYEEDQEILHDISYTFEAGKAYAIVGGSGSGKSTLLNLLMAAGENYKGHIWLGGAEMQEISRETLYDLISVIQQNVFVFNASIADNITMFRSFQAQEVAEAIGRAQLTELVEQRGENYLCGENGKGLSGGEKQRIAIARSLLKKSSVLLADEATAALDAQTAYQVSSDILNLEHITRIVVTHALDETLLQRYDNILVLKEGRVVETGSFDCLMERKGYFYALYTIAQ